MGLKKAFWNCISILANSASQKVKNNYLIPAFKKNSNEIAGWRTKVTTTSKMLCPLCVASITGSRGRDKNVQLGPEYFR